MRKTFNQELLQIAWDNPRVYMILADIGYGEIEDFANAFPERFINCGVAEQNMTGVACGVAMEGNIAITYSIANFPTLRCLEQVRNDVCYHNANVKIIIIGGGMAYGELGISHHSTEDIAIMRALPNIVVLAPCDIPEARAATRAMMAHNGPVYFRCGYKGEQDIHSGPVAFRIGKAITVKPGTDATVFFTGTVGINAKHAVEQLEKEGVRCRLVSMPTINRKHKETHHEQLDDDTTQIFGNSRQRAGGIGAAAAFPCAGATCAHQGWHGAGPPMAFRQSDRQHGSPYGTPHGHESR